jgi:hypothetical protein
MTLGFVPEPTKLLVSAASAHGIPAATCRAGYFPQGSRLCMSSISSRARTFERAMVACMQAYGRVADYHDWVYRDDFGDGARPPLGVWLGPFTGDDRALFVNQNNPNNFEGESNKAILRRYFCAHDRS